MPDRWDIDDSPTLGRLKHANGAKALTLSPSTRRQAAFAMAIDAALTKPNAALAILYSMRQRRASPRSWRASHDLTLEALQKSIHVKSIYVDSPEVDTDSPQYCKV